jgi:hypothetical protein
MPKAPELSTDDRSVTVHVPFAFKRRGGRKRLVVPEGHAPWAPSPLSANSTLVKALARAHRWQTMLDSGVFASIAELAAAERINLCYLARVLRLTLLAPSIVDGILNGQFDAATIKLATLMRPFPVVWADQSKMLNGA